MVYRSIYLRLLKSYFSRTRNTLRFSNTAEIRGFDKKKSIYIYTQTHFVSINFRYVCGNDYSLVFKYSVINHPAARLQWGER